MSLSLTGVGTQQADSKTFFIPRLILQMSRQPCNSSLTPESWKISYHPAQRQFVARECAFVCGECARLRCLIWTYLLISEPAALALGPWLLNNGFRRACLSSRPVLTTPLSSSRDHFIRPPQICLTSDASMAPRATALTKRRASFFKHQMETVLHLSIQSLSSQRAAPLAYI